MEPIILGTSLEHVSIMLSSSFLGRGWGQADVDIAVAGFGVRLHPWFERQDFALFVAQLRHLYQTLSGSAELVPSERQLTFSLA